MTQNDTLSSAAASPAPEFSAVDDLYCLQWEFLLKGEPLLHVTTDHAYTAQGIHPCMLLLVGPDTYEIYRENKQKHQVYETVTDTASQGME